MCPRATDKEVELSARVPANSGPAGTQGVRTGSPQTHLSCSRLRVAKEVALKRSARTTRIETDQTWVRDDVS